MAGSSTADRALVLTLLFKRQHFPACGQWCTDWIAVVTDLPWVAHATHLFAFLMAGQVKVFSNEQLAEAERWIAA